VPLVEPRKGRKMSASKTPIHVVSPESWADAGPVSLLVDMILLLVLKDRATDVFFQPSSSGYWLAYRVDGNVYEMVPAPCHMAQAISQRFKVLCDIDFGSKRSSHHGKMRLVVVSGTAGQP
jgi:type IV pilus assembly protein PilB